jgi:hypothetical protein
MTLENFTSELKTSQVNKGYDYFLLGNVTRLKKTKGDKWTAIVSGTEIYTVIISFHGKNILECHCDCPHDVEFCKHVIAVLYAIREAGKSASSTKKAQQERFANRIDLYIKEVNSYVNQDNRMAEKYEDSNDSAVFRQQLNGLLNKAQTSFKGGCFANAADISLALITCTSSMVDNIDNSGPITSQCVDKSFKLLFGICQSKIPKALKKRIFEYAMDFFDDNKDWQTVAVLSAPDEKAQDLLLSTFDENLYTSGEIKVLNMAKENMRDLLGNKLFLLERMGRLYELEEWDDEHPDYNIYCSMLQEQKKKAESYFQ